LHINKSEKIVMSGNSGTGKTSILNAIMGYVNYQYGDIYITDKRLCSNSITYIRSLIGWLSQDYNFYSGPASDIFIATFLLFQDLISISQIKTKMRYL